MQISVSLGLGFLQEDKCFSIRTDFLMEDARCVSNSSETQDTYRALNEESLCRLPDSATKFLNDFRQLNQNLAVLWLLSIQQNGMSVFPRITGLIILL